MRYFCSIYNTQDYYVGKGGEGERKGKHFIMIPIVKKLTIPIQA